MMGPGDQVSENAKRQLLAPLNECSTTTTMYAKYWPGMLQLC